MDQNQYVVVGGEAITKLMNISVHTTWTVPGYEAKMAYIITGVQYY